MIRRHTITLTSKQLWALKWAAGNSLASAFDAYALFNGNLRAVRCAFRALDILAAAQLEPDQPKRKSKKGRAK